MPGNVSVRLALARTDHVAISCEGESVMYKRAAFVQLRTVKRMFDWAHR